MLLKIIPITATALKLVGNISIANIDLQLVTIGQLQIVINQLTANRQALKNGLSVIGIFKAKMPSVKQYSTKKIKLKGFLI